MWTRDPASLSHNFIIFNTSLPNVYQVTIFEAKAVMACRICNNARHFGNDNDGRINSERFRISDLQASASSCKYCKILLPVFMDTGPPPDEQFSIEQFALCSDTSDWNSNGTSRRITRKGLRIDVLNNSDDWINLVMCNLRG